jgi:hypothetical protein
MTSVCTEITNFQDSLHQKCSQTQSSQSPRKRTLAPEKGTCHRKPIGRLEREIETAQILVFVAQILVFVLFQAKKKTLCSDFIP